jgi:uncharacterized protein YecE (DUF72 family)
VRAWVGTSGWSYGHWRERVYPPKLPQRAWLPWIAERFPTVEINASFYHLPPARTFTTWRAATPHDFVFAVKANRYITHIRRLRDADDSVTRFWEAASALGPKLGPVLVQLPPRFAIDVPVLRAFLATLPRAMRPAFEFRDASWDTDEVRAMLSDAGAAWVLADRPGWRVPLHVTASWSYVRFHQGRPTSPWYPRDKLRRWADRLSTLPVDELFVYFNNDPEGAAIADARTLVDLLAERGVDVSTPSIAGTPASP